MAKLKFGMIVTDMRGKLGGHVFSKNRSGAYSRTKVTPVNPQTASQTAVRSLFAQISQGWSGLTQANRDSFNGRVADYSKTDVFGDLKNPSGKALYQRLNQNLGISNQSLITVAPSPVGVPTYTLSSVDFVHGIKLFAVLHFGMFKRVISRKNNSRSINTSEQWTTSGFINTDLERTRVLVKFQESHFNILELYCER